MSIPPEKLAEGLKLSKSNAERLLRAAKRLEKMRDYPSATLLAFLSLEESAKAAIILKHIKEQKDITETQWTKKISQHVPKLREIIKLIEAYKIPTNIEDFDIKDFDFTTHALFQQWIKEKLTYVDYDFKSQRWTNPFVGSIGYSRFAIGFAEAGFKLLAHLEPK